MKFLLPFKALSVNKAWRGGARYRTKDYIQFEKDLGHVLPKEKVEGDVEVHYKFHLKNYSRTDTSNLIKCLEDIIVKTGLIEDDRKVIYLTARKVKSEVDFIEVEIKEYEKN